MPTMPFTSSNVTQFGDCYFDISQSEKRLVRATLKTFERTGTYVFLKLFEKAAEDYEFEQRNSNADFRRDCNFSQKSRKKT